MGKYITLLHKIVDNFRHTTKTLLPSKEYNIFQHVIYCPCMLFSFNIRTSGSVKVERDENYALNLSCLVTTILFCF